MTMLLPQCIHQIVSMLKHTPDFFKQTSEKRYSTLASHLGTMPALTAYLVSSTEQTFLADLASAVHEIKHGVETTCSPLLLSLLTDIGNLFCTTNTIDAKDTTLGSLIKEAVEKKTSVERTYSLYKLYTTLGIVVPQARVEYAHDLTSEEQDRLLQELHSTHGSLLQPIFVKKTDLLGGIRIFINGVLYDYSIKKNLEHALSSLYSLAS